MALEQALIDELKLKHGAVYVIPIPETDYDDAIDIAVKRPSRGEWKRFRAMLYQDDLKPEASETLAKMCVVHPAPADFTALLLERPALAEKVGSVCTDLAGGGGDAEAKKL